MCKCAKITAGSTGCMQGARGEIVFSSYTCCNLVRIITTIMEKRMINGLFSAMTTSCGRADQWQMCPPSETHHTIEKMTLKGRPIWLLVDSRHIHSDSYRVADTSQTFILDFLISMFNNSIEN